MKLELLMRSDSEGAARQFPGSSPSISKLALSQPRSNQWEGTSKVPGSNFWHSSPTHFQVAFDLRGKELERREAKIASLAPRISHYGRPTCGRRIRPPKLPTAADPGESQPPPVWRLPSQRPDTVHREEDRCGVGPLGGSEDGAQTNIEGAPCQHDRLLHCARSV